MVSLKKKEKNCELYIKRKKKKHEVFFIYECKISSFTNVRLIFIEKNSKMSRCNSS